MVLKIAYNPCLHLCLVNSSAVNPAFEFNARCGFCLIVVSAVSPQVLMRMLRGVGL